MGLFSALFAGVNGINANGNVISVIGDNIANVNTVGFKGSRAEFEDVLAGAESNIGLGSRLANVSAQFTQGGFESSGSVTDLAIDGNGFFVVEDADGSQFFTRAGQFIVDKDGFLVNSNEQKVQGFTVDSSGSITANIGDVVISQAPIQPNATDTIDFQLNLDSNSTAPAAFDEADPSGTSNFSAGVTVYDSLGNSHLVTVYFRKDSSNEWEWFALVDGGELTDASSVSGTPEIEASGTLSFDTQGRLTCSATSASDFDFTGAVQSQAIAFDFGTGTSDSGTGLEGATQFGSDSAIINLAQDGFASGSIKNLEITSSGVIVGNYTNGQNQNVGQLILASFNNQTALGRVGNNNFKQTLASGDPIINAPGSAGKGTVVSQTLEQSNVDLANELIKLVIIQRGFQANSRTIGSVNDMLAQLVTIGQ